MSIIVDFSVFSPLHICVQGKPGNDDLPDLNPPEFTRSMRSRCNGMANNEKRKVNTKLILDNSGHASEFSL